MNLFSNLKGLFTNNLAKRLRPETFVMEKFLMEDVSKHVLKMKKSRFILKIAKYPDHLDLSKKLYLGDLLQCFSLTLESNRCPVYITTEELKKLLHLNW